MTDVMNTQPLSARLAGVVRGGARQVNRRSALGCVLLLSAACAGDDSPLEGPLRLHAIAAAGDTLHWRVEGVATGSRVMRPAVELSIAALDSAGAEPFSRIRTVIGLRDGATVVRDDVADRLSLYDSSGHFVRHIGRPGGGPGEYGMIYGMTALPSDQLVLWDGGGARLNLYDVDGRYIRSWPAPPTGLTSSDGLTSDANGRLYLRAMLRFDPATPETSTSGLVRWDSLSAPDSIPFPRWNRPAPTLLARMPNGMPVSGGTVPYVARDQHRLLADGGLVSGPGDPYQFVLLPGADGTPVRIERAYAPVPIASTEREAIRARIEGEMRQIDPSWSWTEVPIPSSKPAYRGMEVDRDGRIWILVSTPTLDAPQREAPVYDVYHPDGAPIGRVELPPGARFAAASRGYLWLVRTDSLDVPVVERARIAFPAPVTDP